MTETRAPVLDTVGSRAVDVLLVSFNSAHQLRRLGDTLQASAAGWVALRMLAVDTAPSDRSAEILRRYFVRKRGLERWLPLPMARQDLEEGHGTVADCDWVPGCHYLECRAVLDDIGLSDPRFFLYFEEVDHCRRDRSAGWAVTYLPSASVAHIGGESAKSVAALSRDRQISVLEVESELLYTRKHFGVGGLLAHLLLTPIGDAFLAPNDLVKARGVGSALGRSIEVTWSLAAHTNFGTRPTQ